MSEFEMNEPFQSLSTRRDFFARTSDGVFRRCFDASAVQ